ncbi:hypothetical protein MSG28_009568 [Choristoneura fumiferana]|uniref:Uncharacterized protein n=1 Tax=Choristoneura fumiferana TaxID=7141 RepID=A0ACC0JBR2_CHOFU|nr:hypothetical protein MSG28_009568 [Choristoneura fumiferana]
MDGWYATVWISDQRILSSEPKLANIWNINFYVVAQSVVIGTVKADQKQPYITQENIDAVRQLIVVDRHTRYPVHCLGVPRSAKTDQSNTLTEHFEKNGLHVCSENGHVATIVLEDPLIHLQLRFFHVGEDLLGLTCLQSGFCFSIKVISNDQYEIYSESAASKDKFNISWLLSAARIAKSRHLLELLLQVKSRRRCEQQKREFPSSEESLQKGVLKKAGGHKCRNLPYSPNKYTGITGHPSTTSMQPGMFHVRSASGILLIRRRMSTGASGCGRREVASYARSISSGSRGSGTAGCARGHAAPDEAVGACALDEDEAFVYNW